MIKIITRIVPPLDANCYEVIDESTDNRLIIDVGGGFDEVLKSVGNKGKIVGALFTHGHFDHSLDGYKFSDRGVKTYITEKDNELLSNSGNLGRYFGVKTVHYAAEVFLKEGDTEIGGIKFRTIFTPGHTAGSCCFLFGDTLLSGDTLFYGSFGRTDFPTGNLDDLKNSIKEKLFKLPPDTKVYAGHGEPTTIGEEIKYNSINEH